MDGPVPGERRIGAYRLGRCIGSGGMGRVYQARKEGEGQIFAVKVLKEGVAADPVAVRRFLREAEILGSLDHPCIVPVVDHGVSEGHPFLVMPLIVGPHGEVLSLAGRLRSGRLPERDVWRYLRQIGSGLGYAHERGVVHRDLTPANILIDPNHDVRLADFGVALFLAGDHASPLTRPEEVFGTCGYAAPEQLVAAGVVDSRADIYSVGMLVHEMLTGRLPTMSADGVPGTAPELPPCWQGIVAKCLALLPDDRYQTAGEMLESCHSLSVGVEVDGMDQDGIAASDGLSASIGATETFVPVVKEAISSDDGSALAPGTVLDGYQVVGLIGTGGMGFVYRAQQLSLKRDVALKVLSPRLAARQRVLARFQREAEALALLDHPNIVPVLERGNAHGFYYLVMPFVDGPDGVPVTLADLCESGPIAQPLVCHYLLRICQGLAYAHRRGIIHRDIKPSNVLIDCHGEPRVVDFGIAQLRDSKEQFTLPGEVFGTLDYMSPEQRQSCDTVDVRTDIYSLGVMLYEMLCGAPPPRGRFALPGEVGLDPRWDELVDRTLRQNPDERFATVDELIPPLQQLADDLTNDAMAHAAGTDIAAGTILHDRFEVLHRLRNGRDGWLCRDLTDGEEASLLRFDDNPDARLGLADRRGQLAALGRASHPALCAVLGTWQEEGRWDLAFRGNADATLRRRLEHGAVPYAEACGLLVPVAEALDGVHREGVGHGGVSVDAIALWQERACLMPICNPLPPEHDMLGLGHVLLDLLTAGTCCSPAGLERPDAPIAGGEGLPSRVSALLNALFAVGGTPRPDSMAQVARELRDLAVPPPASRVSPSLPQPPSVSAALPSPGHRNRHGLPVASMVKAAVALVLAAAACIGLLLLANRSPDETPVKAEPPAVSVQPDQTLLNLARAEVAWARQKKADLWAPQEMAALEARLAQGTTDMDGGAFNQACRDIRREAKELAESAPARLPAFLQSLRNAYQEARSEEDAKRVAALANVALEIDPECAEAKSILQRAGNRPRVLLLAEQASAAEKRRDWKEAYDLVEEARKLDPDDPRLGQQAERVGGIYAESEHRRARELEEAGKWQQATEAARRACALAAENATYAATKSRIERSAATFQATQWLEEATQKETDGQLDEALSLYQKVGRLTSADLSPEAKALLGRGLSRLPGLLATRETQRVLGEWERLRQQEDWAKARDLLRNTKVDLVSPAVLDRFAGAKALTDRMIDLRERLVAFRSVADVAERLPAARELLRDLAKEAELGQDTGKRRDQLVKWRVAATKPVLVRFVSDNTYRLSVTVHAFDGDTGKATKHYEPFAELELLLPPGRHAYKAWGWAGHAALDRIGFSVGPGDPAKTIRIIGHKDQ